MRAAALAQTHGIEMSSHLFPETSAHLLAATPTSHWLEYVDWANGTNVEDSDKFKARNVFSWPKVAR